MQPGRHEARSLSVQGNAEIYSKYRYELLRYATALVGPSHADDVVSTVVLKTIRRRSLDELENPRGYLLKGILNEARGWSRRQNHTRVPHMIERTTPPDLGEVVDAVRRLSVQQRAATYLHYWESVPVVEIAEIMGIGVGTVKRYLFLAQRHLKGALR
ncbi:MAG TPA: sigma-70 family RNA polymerase sigma factor [Actinobacteria bacterium]|nr:sigma-70 family RNA polymerase sigma factor [Actinomycetota bacterium]